MVITSVSWVVDGFVSLNEDVTRLKGDFTDVLNLLVVSELGDYLNMLGPFLFWPQETRINLCRIR